MRSSNHFRIAVLPGDGIGKEVMSACIEVLDTIQRKVGGFKLDLEYIHAGAEYFLEQGVDITYEAMDKVKQADAILLGAMGLQDVRLPNGTEIAPHLKIRTELGLFAGVRPVKAYPNTPQRLADARSQEIDFVVLRESTEGLFAEREKGVILEDREARDTMVITRQTCENLFDFAFKLSQSRKQKGGKGRVTCVDKSNVLRSMVFFRKIFDERALLFPDLQSDHNYVDAQALDLIRRPWEFDVLVMENMFADILSDLGGGLVGGMGMAPCAEIGLKHGLFQPAHGSAPDIMGKDLANPTAMFLSAAMMLEWLGQKYQNESLMNAARLLESKIEEGFRFKRTQPKEFGGPHGCSEHTRNLLEILKDL